MTYLHIILLFFLSCVIRVEGQNCNPRDTVPKPKGVLDQPAEFSGPKGINPNDALLNEVRIGLFLPRDSLNNGGQSLLNAATLAIDELNFTGGYKGIPYRLINRWSSDPWGAGSKEMIKLVYQDSVLAVIGSINGIETHIAEQIATKAWLPLLSPISADPTLTYIRIPWIFRLPPEYKAQSEVLVREGVKLGKMEKIGLITANNHDGRIFAEDLNDVLSKNQIWPIFHFEVSRTDFEDYTIVQRILSFNPYSIIICLSKENILKLLSELENHTPKIDIFIPWIPGLDYDEITNYYRGKMHYIEPFQRSANPEYEKFASKYYSRYGSKPTFGAAYTYDAAYILAGALQKSGLNRARLREYISMMENFHGVTGNISWDNGGGNKAQPIYRSISGGDYSSRPD
jgi:branched-chain amino acid transport system substrate-binding protein